MNQNMGDNPNVLLEIQQFPPSISFFNPSFQHSFAHTSVSQKVVCITGGIRTGFWWWVDDSLMYGKLFRTWARGQPAVRSGWVPSVRPQIILCILSLALPTPCSHLWSCYLTLNNKRCKQATVENLNSQDLSKVQNRDLLGFWTSKYTVLSKKLAIF